MMIENNIEVEREAVRFYWWIQRKDLLMKEEQNIIMLLGIFLRRIKKRRII